eukprot:scaffold805_cov165-Amphora_coffeaeformis.AAC.1
MMQAHKKSAGATFAARHRAGRFCSKLVALKARYHGMAWDVYSTGTSGSVRNSSTMSWPSRIEF